MYNLRCTLVKRMLESKISGQKSAETRGRNMVLTTLCYIEKEDSFLMLHRVKKEKDVNKDKWIGVGGKFKSGESPDECLLREVWEETGLRLTSYRPRGILTFQSVGWEQEYIFLYTADGFEGEITDCMEGNLEWVPKGEVERLNLWEGDKLFLKLLGEDAPFFSLKLSYQGNTLVEAILDGRQIVPSVSENENSK